MMNYDELTEQSKKAHQEDVRQYDKGQNALCFVVLGSISLIVSVLFLVLSFKRSKNKMTGIEPLSLQFFICVICGVIAVGCLVYGIIKFVKSYKARKKLAAQIKEINIMKKEIIDSIEKEGGKK